MNLTIPENSFTSSTLGAHTRELIQNGIEKNSIEGEIEIHFIGRLSLFATAVCGAAEATIRVAVACFAQMASLFSLYQSETINKFAQKETGKWYNSVLVTTAASVALASPRLFPTVFKAPEGLEGRLRKIQESANSVQKVAEAITALALLPFQVFVLLPIVFTVQIFFLPLIILTCALNRPYRGAF